MSGRLNAIRYGQWQRWADTYQGWRDGHAGVPERPNRPGPVTTPHRESLIRLAQDAFAREHLEYQKSVAEPHRQIEAGRSRLAAAKSALAWAESAARLDLRELTGPETRRRRLGEDRHPESVIVQRRLRERVKLRARARAEVARAQSTVSTIEGEVARAEEAAEQHHEAAVVRVQRIHQYIHRRLAVYRRALVRAHPDGAWVNWALSVQTPEIPTWALPDAYLPERAAFRAQATQEPPDQPPTEADEAPSTIALNHDVTRFGSAPAPAESGEIGYETLDGPLAAPWHFTIIKTANGLRLRTRGYDHGPYIAGEPVREADLLPGDFFDFGERRYAMLDGSNLSVEELPDRILIAADLGAMTDGRPRLSGMSFVQRENRLLAVLGPSGAGKSSLCFALLGELPVQPGGRLFFRKMPMDTHLKQIRDQVSFVPQETGTQPTLHMSLTVEATLRYGFNLRSPDKQDRDERIEAVLEDVYMTGRRHQLLRTLSGGQLRRVSIALELLTEQPLLMLDEPTSGLDASMDRQIMEILRKHAENGHTVIVVTHSTEHLSEAHEILVVVEGGTPAYFGPPRQIRKQLNFKAYADLMSWLLDEEKRAEYVNKYRAGAMVKEAMRAADGVARETTAQATRRQSRRLTNRSFRAVLRQFLVLVRRQCALLATGGKKNTDPTWWQQIMNARLVLIPLLVAMGSAALAALVAGSPGLGAVPSEVGPTALALLTTLCVLSGQALTYSDVISEFEIIRREYRAGVGVLPALTAKWVVYAVLAISQAGLITVVFCWFPDRAPQRSVWLGPEIDLFLGLAALSVAAMTLGMLVSTLAAKLEHAVALITATSIAQIALNGVTAALATISATSVLAAALPDRWGLAAVASSMDLRGINQGRPTQVGADALWTHSLGQWLQDLGGLAGLSLVFFVLAIWRLHTRLRPQSSAHARGRAWVRWPSSKPHARPA
jgi:ABC transport system ATP-binding/permease protein